MALAAVWERFWAPQGAQAGPGGPRGGRKTKIRRILPKRLWLQSGSISELSRAAKHHKEITILLNSNLRIKILIRSLAISGCYIFSFSFMLARFSFHVSNLNVQFYL